MAANTASKNPNVMVHRFLDTLVLSHTSLSFLIPLIISLFYFSTPQGRRQPIFILNISAILLAFVVGVLCDGLAISMILDPLNPWPITVNLAIGFISVCQSILVDLTLLLRVIFVYPLAQVGRIRFALLVAIPIILKLARVINLILFTRALADAMSQPNGATISMVVFTSAPYIKIEWASQMIDNTYATLAFLWKLHHQRKKGLETSSSRVTVAQRMRTLFNMALTNFVLPAILSIVQFVCLYNSVDVLVLIQIIIVNTMLSTFCVALATVWAGQTSRREARALDSKRHIGSGLAAEFTVGIRRSTNSTGHSEDREPAQ